MTEQITGVGSVTAEPRPRSERLSDIEMGDLLASVGNHEAKALTLIFMSGGNIYTRVDLRSAFLFAQGETPAWSIDKKLPFGYCKESLEPIGLVAKETIDENLNTYGYQITEKGENLGVPLAGLLLDFALRHHISLYSLFGSTNSNGGKETNGNMDSDFKKRSPLTRYKIFYELVTNPNLRIREADIEKETGLRSGVLDDHLQILKREGIIGYDSIEYDKPRTFYSLVQGKEPGTPRQYKSLPTLTQNVFEVIKFEPEREWSTEEVAKKLREKGWNPRSETGISSVLSHLRNEGYLRVRKFSKYDGVLSEISLDNSQREMLVELIGILDKVASNDPEALQKGRRFALGIASDPGKARQVMKIAREKSSSANQKTKEERINQILSIIQIRPSITPQEIVTFLQESGEKIGYSGVGSYLRQISKDGSATFKTRNNVSHWYSIEPEDSTPQETEVLATT